MPFPSLIGDILIYRKSRMEVDILAQRDIET